MQEADVGAARKVFDLDLPELGPYNLAFTRSGAHLLLGGRRGHLALMDWQQRHLVCELQVPGPFPLPGLSICNDRMLSCICLHARGPCWQYSQWKGSSPGLSGRAQIKVHLHKGCYAMGTALDTIVR